MITPQARAPDTVSLLSSAACRVDCLLPATGHTKGDIIAVNGEQFEVNYFYVTPAYRNTLAHGGVLGPGVYARIYYHNGEILRVDIRQ